MQHAWSVSQFSHHPYHLNEGKNGVNLLQMCVVLIHHDNRDTIPLTWILIDNFSTDSLTNNLEMIENVRTCTEDEKLIIITNVESKYYESMVSLNILPMEVHSNTDLMANILSVKILAYLSGVKITHRIYDSLWDNSYV